MTAPTTGVFRYVTQVVHDYLCAFPAHTPLHPPGVLPTDVRVSTEVPASRPARLVTIDTASTAGGNNIALSPRRVIIQCRSIPEDPTISPEAATSELAELVYAFMKAAYCTPGNGIRDVVTVGTPARFDDPDDSTPRFQMTLDVLLRAHFHNPQE